MMISNQEQLTLLLRCLGFGVWLNLMSIPLERFRRHLIRTKPVRFLFDTIIMLPVGLSLFLFALAVNNGELRAIMLTAMTVGFLVSNRTIGRIFGLVLDGLNRLYTGISTLWMHLLQKSGSQCRKLIKKVIFFYKKGLQTGGNWVYNRNNK